MTFKKVKHIVFFQFYFYSGFYIYTEFRFKMTLQNGDITLANLYYLHWHKFKEHKYCIFHKMKAYSGINSGFFLSQWPSTITGKSKEKLGRNIVILYINFWTAITECNLPFLISRKQNLHVAQTGRSLLTKSDSL